MTSENLGVANNGTSPLHPWDDPMYSATEAGRLTGVRPERIRRWLRGYDFAYEIGPDKMVRRVHQEPVVRRPDSTESTYASFLDLIDLLFVKKFLEHGVSLQKLRKALAEAEALLGGHHFAQRSFFTDGSDIYLQVQMSAGALLELLSGGQWVIAPVIREIAHQIEFHDVTGFAERWFPLGRSGRIVVDPRIAFGAPSITDRAVKTANVYDLYLGENHRVGAVAAWMDLSYDDVRAAVDYEEHLRAA